MAADPITETAINELLSYDFSDNDDPFADKPAKKRDDKTTLSPRGLKRAAGDDDKENFGGLGLDEEVKITKKKRPNPKLDEDRYALCREKFPWPFLTATDYSRRLGYPSSALSLVQERLRRSSVSKAKATSSRILHDCSITISSG